MITVIEVGSQVTQVQAGNEAEAPAVLLQFAQRILERQLLVIETRAGQVLYLCPALSAVFQEIKSPKFPQESGPIARYLRAYFACAANGQIREPGLGVEFAERH